MTGHSYSQPDTTQSRDLLARLRAMPSSLNDACRTMEEAAGRLEELTRVAQMAKAAAEMELGIAAAPDFSPRDMLYAACGALGLPLEGRGGAT
ncbi:MAG: hypothetical protein NVS3B5_21120 [Sphingomicrobium sp.]